MNCFELFAGCGGLGYGFHKEGFNIVVANELEENIAVTYKHNFPETNVIVTAVMRCRMLKYTCLCKCSSAKVISAT